MSRPLGSIPFLRVNSWSTKPTLLYTTCTQHLIYCNMFYCTTPMSNGFGVCFGPARE